MTRCQIEGCAYTTDEPHSHGIAQKKTYEPDPKPEKPVKKPKWGKK